MAALPPPRLSHRFLNRFLVKPDLFVKARDVAVGDEPVGEGDVEQMRLCCRDRRPCVSAGEELGNLREQPAFFGAVLHGNPNGIFRGKIF